MILNKTRETDLLQIGETLETKSMGIDPDSTDILMDFLSKNIYSDYEGSVVRECCSNAYDSHIAAGIEKDTPIMVRLSRAENYRWEFTVEDFGIGMNQEIVDNVISQYLKSTKRSSNTQLGQKGLGFKCPLAYTGGNPFVFIGRKDGIESKWMMYEADEGNKIDTVYTKETTEKNGVKVIVPIKSYQDAVTFSNKIREQLSYFKNVYVVDEYRTFNNDYKIYQNDLFSWSEISNDHNLHINLGGVYYPIDFKKLDMSQVSLPVAIKIGLDDQIEPTLSRESITYSPFAKKYLRDKIKEVLTWFVEKYNETTHYKTFRDAYNVIDDGNKVVTIGDKDFYITGMDVHTDVKFRDVSVEGIEMLDLKVAKKKESELYYDYYVDAYDTREGVWKKDKVWKTKTLQKQSMEKYPIVVVNDTLSGNIKEYIREKYSKQPTMYLTRREEGRRLGLRLDGTEGRLFTPSYYNLLELDKYPREKWRQLIQEWQLVVKEMTSGFIEELKIENKPEYQKWLAEKKQRIKDERESPYYKPKYKALGKVKGDITLMTAREFKYGGKLSWDKSVSPIATLHQYKGLTVYFNKQQELPEDLYDYFKMIPKVRFVQLNPSEIKHVKDLHNYITMSELLKSSPFNRMVTSILAHDLLDLEPNNPEIIYDAFPKYKELKERIEAYEYQNRPSGSVSREFKDAAIQEAKDSNLFDQNIYPELMQFQSVMDKFGFLDFLKSAGNTEERRVCKNMMYIMLKNRMVTGKSVEDFELVPKEQLVQGTPEQIAAEEELYSQYEAIAA